MCLTLQVQKMTCFFNKKYRFEQFIPLNRLKNKELHKLHSKTYFHKNKDFREEMLWGVSEAKAYSEQSRFFAGKTKG